MSDRKTIRTNVTAEDTWSDPMTIGEHANGYIRVGVAGTVNAGTYVRARVADPEYPTEYWYSDDVLAVTGQTFQVAFVPGPAIVEVGCKEGEFGAASDFVISTRLSTTEGGR